MGQCLSKKEEPFLDSEVSYTATTAVPTASPPIPMPAEFKFPPAVQRWIDEEQDTQDDDRSRAQAKEVLPWLINTIITAHTNPRNKQAAVALLLKPRFTTNLGFLRCWDPLREGLTAQLNTLGAELHELYTKLDLGEALSDRRIGCDKLKYHAKLPQQAHHDPLTHASLFPNLDNFFDFSGDHPEAMDERELLIVILMISKVCDGVFKNKVQTIIGNVKGATLHSAPPKQYPRALNKSFSDHQGKPQPRTAYNIDTVRALLMVSDPDTLIQVFQLLTEGFNGVAKVKNLFTLSPTERADRFHLLTLMLTVVVDSGMTFGEMVNDPECLAVIDEFIADVPHSEPKERWEAMCKRALEYLSQPSIANLSVLLLAELQIILQAFADIRKMMHLLYKAVRAETPGQLYDDFLHTYGERPVEAPVSDLFNAACDGQLSVAARLLDGGADVDDANNSYGATPLLAASQNNHPDVVKMLIECSPGASVNLANDHGDTPLFSASQRNHLEVVKLLVSNNAAINQANNTRSTPLTIASEYNHLQVVKFLVSNNAAINQAQNGGVTPLIIASHQNHLEVVKVLVSNNAAINQATNDGVTPLIIASQENRLEVVKLLVSNNAAINQANDEEITPLTMASQQNHLEVVKLLVSNNAAINQAREDGTTPLTMASHQNHLEVVKLLVSNNAAINQAKNSGATPLLVASEENHVEVVKVLVSNNAAINQANNIGSTPLFMASQENHLEVVKLLVSNNAAINQPPNHGATPLNVASQNNNLEVVKLLVSNNGAINQAKNTGSTPLVMASQNNHLEVVKFLVSNNAAINQAANSGQTP